MISPACSCNKNRIAQRFNQLLIQKTGKKKKTLTSLGSPYKKLFSYLELEILLLRQNMLLFTLI